MSEATPESVADRLGIAQTAHVSVGRLVRWLLSALLIAAVIAAGVVAWNQRGQAAAVSYVTEPVVRGDLLVTVTATGNLVPTNQVQVGSELSGIVRSVEVDYDERVKVGQVLAQLDTTKLEAQINQVEAALSAANARVRQAEATEEEALAAVARAERLAASQLIPQSDLDAARAAAKRAVADRVSALAAVDQTEATLRAHRADLGKMTIRSPIDGVVLARAIDRGQTIAASFQAPVLFTLAQDLTRMELDVDVDEADVGQVQPGQEATFTVDAYPDRSFTALVSAVRLGSQKLEGVVTYKTILYVDNSNLLLRPGMTATAEIAVKHATDVVLVPNAALRFVPPDRTTSQTSSGGGALVTRLLPRRPRTTTTAPAGTGTSGQRQRIWVLRDGRPVEVAIAAGSTDGRMTEVVTGEIEPGVTVIVDAGTPGS